ASLLITTQELRPILTEYTGDVLYLDEIPSLPLPSAKINADVKPQDTFILLYTSGSTGVPKGVKLTHANIVCNINWYIKRYELTEEDRCGEYASYGFDMHMYDPYSALSAGAAAVVVPDEYRLDFHELNEYYERNKVTHVFMTTQVGRQFAVSVQNHSLKTLTVGGEKLVTLDPPKEYTFINGYGPTETTMLVSAMDVVKAEMNIPIGKPLDNTKLYVVDENLRRLPIGAIGELLIAGLRVGDGYLNRPDKTAEVFIKNPFEKGEYENAYRSGDIVRYRSDGNIEFIGRRDGQVKINGFRIELTEVEAVIRDYPGVKDATVAAFDHPAGGKFIAAYVVGDEPLDTNAIGEFIKERKPPYMVPAAFMQLEKIPLNQNSKVNKRALPKPELKSHAKSADTATAAPLNVLEKELKDIVAKIVNSEDFGITDHLGDLGITSISGISLATAVFRKYGVQVKVRELVSHGSIQSIENDILTHLLYSQKEEKEESSSVREPAAASKKACRLTFAQQGVFAECQANPDTVQYNIPVDISMPQGVDEKRLEAAVRTVIDAHPYICCRFVPDKDGEIIQEAIPDFKLQIPVRELSDTEFDGYRQEFVRPFDLSSGPAFRFEIIKTGDKVHLLADLHHLISDGASEDIFVKQLCLALDGKEIEKENYDYYAFAAEESIDEETEAFFEEKMADAGEATRIIPDVFEEGLPHTERSARIATDISSVTEFSKKAGITPASLYLAAAFLTLSRFVCEDTAAIATVSNGRSNLKLSDTMGMFVNTLPLSARLDNSEKTEDYLKRVSKLFSDTIAHENYPFARIASKYDFHPSVSFTYQIGVMNEYGIKEGRVNVSVLNLDIAKIPVALYIDGTTDEACIRVNYDSSMYSEAIALSIAQSMENVVRGLMSQESISGISLTDEKQWEVLDGYNSPWDLEYDKGDSAVSVFRRTAASHPDKTAAVFKDKSYTYRELDELTDALAAKIYCTVSEATGKKDLKEMVTAILLPRDENVFIMPLAVIKTGMAYEPLDPAYPKDRLNFMVNDAKAGLLICADDLTDLVDEYKGPVLKVSELYSMEEKEPVAADPSPKDLFIMLYTSGSTGTPKGCQIEHGNLVSYAHGVRNDFYREDDRIAAYASFGFDVNMSDVFCTLLNGGTVYLIPEEIRMELGALASYFDKEGITALLLTTQVGVQFLQNYPKLKTLRMLVMGGEKLPAVDPKALSYTIVNGYGPTENCCGVSLFAIREWEPNIPIGKPMATIHGYVLDRTGHRLPAGAAGEYCLAGPQVSRGYLNRPDKTAEAYEDCPFGQFRMYHTGDIVRYRTNGDVEFVGRRDGQVKIRGFRIETKEIEAVIREYEGISNVTVQAYDYEGGGKYLAAFVVSSDSVDTEKLAGFIKERKPAYMVPAVIMQIEEIPLTVNQKVDKKALPAPKLQKAAYVAPVGQTEEDFCAIFGQVLGIEKVSAEDDFFDIGGSSILAMKVVLAAGKAGYDIVYNDVFTYTTPRELAGFVDKEDKTASQPLIFETETPGEIPSTGPDGYDYTAIHELMEKNTIEAFKNGTRHPVSKDVLLLGAT
ncbi:MAG: amino acid adenylation domain-containing protein, partial [Lachnospiraceae bacterium]|nr:amino acid adenylation domain-containing protein [Lachnospiraceae bacterium]